MAHPSGGIHGGAPNPIRRGSVRVAEEGRTVGSQLLVPSAFSKGDLSTMMQTRFLGTIVLVTSCGFRYRETLLRVWEQFSFC